MKYVVCVVQVIEGFSFFLLIMRRQKGHELWDIGTMSSSKNTPHCNFSKPRLLIIKLIICAMQRGTLFFSPHLRKEIGFKLPIGSNQRGK